MAPQFLPKRLLSTANCRRFAAIGCVLVCGLVLLPRALAESSAPSVVSSIEDGLEFDENNKLSSHYVVFPANRPDCGTHPYATGAAAMGEGFLAHPLEGEALEKVFPHYRTGKSYLGRDPDEELEDGVEDNRCLAACLEKGTDIKVAGHTMPHLHFTDYEDTPANRKQKNFENFLTQSCRKVEVCFINYVVKERPLEVFWLNNGNPRKKQFDLQYSEQKTRCFKSFVGHQFLAVDEESGFEETITIGHITTYAFGTSPPSSSQKFSGRAIVEKRVKSALDMEWRKHQMVKRTFSSLGFAKGKLPDDVFANMAAFYYNNRHNAVNEEWEGKGVFVNWWETDVKFVAIPWDIKHKWQLRLMELVSEWAGVEVEETSMYGLRQYETGARLLSHVDRLPTHAVSLIVNIAQDNLATPWPIEVFDHADRLHEITMEAGEIVYYESAKNLHSRNRPLTCKEGGCRFINLFTHYRPVNDGSQWHENLSDMPNRPPPLLEGQVEFDNDEASCQAPTPTTRRNLETNTNDTDNDNTNENNDMDNSLGVGTVECNDRRLGSYISPTLFKAREADDLFRWWKATADANLIGFDENQKAVYRHFGEGTQYQYNDEEETAQAVRDRYYDDDDDEYEDDEDDDAVGPSGKDEL